MAARTDSRRCSPTRFRRRSRSHAVRTAWALATFVFHEPSEDADVWTLVDAYTAYDPGQRRPGPVQ